MMPHDGNAMTTSPILADLQTLTKAALPEVESLFNQARDGLKAKVSTGGKVSNQALEARQFQAHALSWLATYTEALRQMRAWAGRLQDAGQFGAFLAKFVTILAEQHGEILGFASLEGNKHIKIK